MPTAAQVTLAQQPAELHAEVVEPQKLVISPPQQVVPQQPSTPEVTVITRKEQQSLRNLGYSPDRVHLMIRNVIWSLTHTTEISFQNTQGIQNKR